MRRTNSGAFKNKPDIILETAKLDSALFSIFFHRSRAEGDGFLTEVPCSRNSSHDKSRSSPQTILYPQRKNAIAWIDYILEQAPDRFIENDTSPRIAGTRSRDYAPRALPALFEWENEGQTPTANL